MSDEKIEQAPTQEEGQQLCLACGMCCNGDLYLSSWLYTEELPKARSLVLKIVSNSVCKNAFEQPCPKHIDDRCTVYDDPRKPDICSTYRCKLLKRYLKGEIGLEKSLGYIRQARSMIARLREEIKAVDGVSFWPQLGKWSRRDEPRDLETRLEIGVLMRLLSKIFMPSQARADPVEFPES